MSTITTSSRRRAVWALCGMLCSTLLLCASFVPGGTTSARVYTGPTKTLYFCPNEGTYLTLSWTRPMPYGGWLGQATTSETKDVQAYDAQSLNGGVTSWGFQAQDGSFVCRMYVSSNQNSISFGNCRPSATPWTITSCFNIY